MARAPAMAASLSMAVAPVPSEVRDAGANRPAIGKGAVPLNRPARTGTAGGIGAAGAAAATQSGDPAVILSILVLTAALAAGVFFFWRWWQKRQQDAPA